MMLTLVSNELKKIFIETFNLLTPSSLALFYTTKEKFNAFLADRPILYPTLKAPENLWFFYGNTDQKLVSFRFLNSLSNASKI